MKKFVVYFDVFYFCIRRLSYFSMVYIGGSFVFLFSLYIV